MGSQRSSDDDAQAAFTWAHLSAWIRRCADLVAEHRDHLTDLDAAIGDGDHGTNMHRGFQAVLGKLEAPDAREPDMGAALKSVGMTLLSTVGGVSGPLYGRGVFMELGAVLAGRQEAGPGDWAAGLEAAVRRVQAQGKAQPGDKTMVDALVPALDALQAALGQGAGFGDALARAAGAAAEGMRSTIPMVARKGRASYLGERSAGHQDPGATSSYLLVQAAAETLARPAGAR